MHNRLMRIVWLTFLLLAASGAAFAQDPQPAGDPEGSSQQVEESDEAYRRRMELEDARRRDPTYTDPANSYRRDLEKIDKLPKESRENIRDQLVDIIMENPDWQPGDALKEYPYEPTAAAKADPELAQQEQEAWDEQIEKYHTREAEAFGAYRGPVQGPGNPDGADGAEGGQQGSEGGQQGGQDGQAGQEGGEGSESDNRNAGTYQPYQSQSGSREDAVSTKGVSESALDFLRQRQAGQPSGRQSSSAAAEASAQSQEAAQQDAQPQQQQAQQQDSESESQDQTTEPDMRGIIAIEDLDKLEGTGSGRIVVPPPEEDDEEDPDGR